MSCVADFGNYETAWCPGCGNFPILETVKHTFAKKNLNPKDILLVSGIGQSAKLPHYLNANVFNGLHGRALPVATAAKMINPNLNVVVHSGEGCNYGEGGNHFLAAIRRNVNITLIVHNNQIYGLTKGQASPTSDQGTITKAQPFGAPSSPFNPLAVAISLQAGFVARSFSGNKEHLSDMISKAMDYQGFSLVDVLMPCVSFNKVNNFLWYKNRCKEINSSYDPTEHANALQMAMQWGDDIPIGVIYQNDRSEYMTHFPQIQSESLCEYVSYENQFKDVLNQYY